MSRPSAAALLLLLLTMTGCTSAPPRDPDNLCRIFAEKPRWYRAARAAEKNWDLPVPVAMAFIHRESSYVSDARPPRGRLLWVIPWRRPSSAYGYAQATDEAWSDYLDDRGGIFSERDDMRDALDFVGWYNHRSHRKLGLSMDDAYSLYLAYYVGPGGYARGTWRRNDHAQRYAGIVARRAERYARQLDGCESRLARRRWLLF